MVKVYPIFDICKAIGKNEIEIDASNIKDMIEKARKQYGDDFSKMSKKSHILVNGRNINYLKGLKTKLNDGDKVHFVSPAAGG